MQDETLRLQSRVHKLEELLEKQRWMQKEQALKFEKTINRLERELEEQKFQSQYQKEQVQRFQLVLRNLNEGIYAMDADGNVFAVNARAHELLDEDLVVPILLEASTGQDVSKVVELQNDNYSPQELLAEVIPQAVSVFARPLKDEEEKIVGSIAVVRPINS